MLNNRWLTGSLLLGMIIAVSLVSSIPTYTSGVMQKLLISELEEYQLETNEFPGIYSFADSFAQPVANPAESFSKVETIHNELAKDVDLPILDENIMFGTRVLQVDYEDEVRREQDQTQRNGKLVMITGIEDHITLLDGQLPSQDPVDGVIEVMVSEEALYSRKIVLGTSLIISNRDKDIEYTIKPVGVFKRDSEESTYWSLIANSLSQDFIVHEDWFRDEIIDKHEEFLWYGRFSTTFDYHQITEAHFPVLLNLSQNIESQISKFKETDMNFEFPIKDIIRKYEDRRNQMTTMLWSLNVPVMIMLAIYLYMISQLIVNRQLEEIAVFSSRGASKLQVWLIYLIEVLILGFIAFLIGPFIGLQFSKILGASNNFLEFVQRSTLPVQLSGKSYLYGFFTVVIVIIMVMIPVFRAAGTSIVNHKQKKARNSGKVQWIFVFLEIALLSFAVYELVSFNKRQKELLDFNVESADLMIDPILFLLPSLFIIGLGLVTLRIYPWLLKSIFKIGEKRWSFSLYSTFLQVSRSSKQYQFLMLFLVMTIGMGVFSASAARTINANLEEQIYYQNGAEVRLQQHWSSNAPPPIPDYLREELDLPEPEVEEVIYREPPFEPIQNLKNVETTAKVFEKEAISVRSGKQVIDYAQLMAIETNDFGETAWFKDSLLPHHWYEYLNLLANEPSAVLVSKQTATALNLEQGDTISVRWPGSEVAEFIVYGIVDYWPSFNPLAKVDQEGKQVGALVVANLNYVQTMIGLEPYEVWLNLKSNTSRAEFYEDIENEGLLITSMNDIVPQVTKLKNSALLLGVNGSMTMGFLISLLISFIGFLLYWILTIHSRTLQYGIYRAMGVSVFKLSGIMIWEQIFTSGIACILGVIIGGVTSYLYVPLFKISLAIDQLAPPFSVIIDTSDEMKIYIFVSIMLSLGALILIGFIRRIEIAQSIKLGED